jgi:hypothetical protein
MYFTLPFSHFCASTVIYNCVQIKAVVINQDLEVKAEAHVHFDSMLPEYRFLPFFHDRAQCLWNRNDLLRFWFRFWKNFGASGSISGGRQFFNNFKAESCLFIFDLKKFHFTLFPVPNPASEPGSGILTPGSGIRNRFFPDPKLFSSTFQK